MTSQQECSLCPICKLVIENHDFDMVVNCVRGSGYSVFQILFDHLKKVAEQ